MTRMLDDILRQPAALRGVLARLSGSEALRRARAVLDAASEVRVVGIGASFHAATAVATLREGARADDASELLHATSFRRGTALLVLSRSGRSVEVVGLLEIAARHGLRVVAVTNDAESPLARGADVVLPLGVAFDHAVSIVTYSALALAGALAVVPPPPLDDAFGRLPSAIVEWSAALEAWAPPAGPAYFLGRGGSLATAHEARLLWEEAAKAPATALTTGGFRHGPQEVVRPGLLVGLWIHAARRRPEDLALSRDLRSLGAHVMAVGQRLPADAGDLVVQVPSMDPDWQFVLDAIPAQLAAERAARARGVDCDAFRLCEHVVVSEGGLLASPRVPAPMSSPSRDA